MLRLGRRSTGCLVTALPFMLDRLLKPSVERTVWRGLRRGFGSALDALRNLIVTGCEAAQAEARRFCEEGGRILRDTGAPNRRAHE